MSGGLRLARVVAVHPERRTVDLTFLDDGSTVAGALVSSPSAFSDGGGWNVPDVPKPASQEEAAGLAAAGRGMIALVGFAGGWPVVVNFMHAGDGQMAFSEQDRACYRHPSGTYVTIAPDGSLELSHPSGAYLRLGSGDSHEALGPKAASGTWSIPGAGQAWPTLVFETKDIRLTAADGEVAITATRRITLTAGATSLELRDDGSSWRSPDIAVDKA